MKNIEMFQKLSVLHCVYQMIASADGHIDEDRDVTAIELALSELGLNSVYSWDSALTLNPNDCFTHIAALNGDEKLLFRSLLLSIADMGGNTAFRTTCTKHIIQLCMAEQ
jgi:hypothetical protein